VGLVLGTDAAVEGTVEGCCGAGVSKAIAVASESSGSLVLFIVRPVDILKLSVFWALLLYVNLVILFEDGGV